MANRPNATLERFYNCLISGNRQGARTLMDEVCHQEPSGQGVVHHLIWPTLHAVQTMRRNDQISRLAYNYATRLMRSLTDQLQPKLEQHAPRHARCLVVCGAEESEELAGQITADLLEADGYDVFFTGGGISNDEIVAQLGELKIDKLIVFGAIPATIPETRLLIDYLHDIGSCPNLQIIVGGGIFTRADGLAEEIGADLWANDPIELVQKMAAAPDRRMDMDQRTVGRRRAQQKREQTKKKAA